MSNLGGKNVSEDTDKDLGVDGIVAGTNIDNIDSTDPRNPIINAAAGAGEVNTNSNDGTGDGKISKTKVGSDLPLKSIKAGTNITVTNNADDIEIAADTPITTKGDILSFDTAENRLPVGTNGQVLEADSAQALGLKWATPSAAGDVATDVIWDAKGDLAGGTGADTASRLAVGSDDQVLTADAAEATGMKWAAAAGGGATASNIISTTTLGADAGTIPITLSNLTEFDFDISYPLTNPAPSGVALFINGNTTDSNYQSRGVDCTTSLSVVIGANPNIGGLDTTKSCHTHGTVRVVGSRVIVKTFHMIGETKYAMRTSFFDIATTDITTFTVSGRGTDLASGTKVIIYNPFVAAVNNSIRTMPAYCYDIADVYSYSTSTNATKGGVFDVTTTVTIDSITVPVNLDAAATYKFMICEVSGVNIDIDVILHDSSAQAATSGTESRLIFDLGATGVTLLSGKKIAFILVRTDGTGSSICEVPLPADPYSINGLIHDGFVTLANNNPVVTTALGSTGAANGLAMQMSFRLADAPPVADAENIEMSIFLAGVPGNAIKISTMIVASGFTLPVSLTGSTGFAEVTATATATVDIKKNGSAIGTVDFAIGTNAATFTFASPVTFVSGDRLQLVNQGTADATLADIAITLRGDLT